MYVKNIKMKRRTKKIIRHAVIYAVALILAFVATFGLFKGYEWLHRIATLQRGYEAVGGEALIFALPFLVYIIYINVRDTIDIIKKI